MKTILLGYPDVDGKGKATVLAGPEISITEQAQRAAGIKASGKYPDGIVRVEFCELVVRDTGISISANTARHAELHSREAERIAALKKADPVQKTNEAKGKLRAELAKAAQARNALISKLVKVKTDGGEPKEVAKLEEAIATAQREVNTIENKLSDLLNPKK